MNEYTISAENMIFGMFRQACYATADIEERVNDEVAIRLGIVDAIFGRWLISIFYLDVDENGVLSFQERC
jgi:hypothetical protein